MWMHLEKWDGQTENSKVCLHEREGGGKGRMLNRKMPPKYGNKFSANCSLDLWQLGFYSTPLLFCFEMVKKVISHSSKCLSHWFPSFKRFRFQSWIHNLLVCIVFQNHSWKSEHILLLLGICSFLEIHFVLKSKHVLCQTNYF